MLKLVSRFVIALTTSWAVLPAIALAAPSAPATSTAADTPVCYMQTATNQMINLENLCGQRSPNPTSTAMTCPSPSQGSYITSRSGEGSVYVPATVRKGEGYNRDDDCR